MATKKQVRRRIIYGVWIFNAVVSTLAPANWLAFFLILVILAYYWRVNQLEDQLEVLESFIDTAAELMVEMQSSVGEDK